MSTTEDVLEVEEEMDASPSPPPAPLSPSPCGSPPGLGAGGEERAWAGGEEVEGAWEEEVEGEEGIYVSLFMFCTFHTDGLEDPSGAEAPEEEGTVLYSPTLAD